MHGWGNFRESGNWHRWLVARRRSVGDAVLYPQFPNAGSPALDPWLDLLTDELSMLHEIDDPGETLVIAHSLAATLWVHASARGRVSPSIGRVLLVAPAHPEVLAEELPEFVIDLAQARTAVQRAAANTLVVGGDVDEWQPRGVQSFAEPLGLEHSVILGAGHMSRLGGFSRWPQVDQWIDNPSVPLNVQGEP